MTVFLTLFAVAIVIVILAMLTMLSGRGHLDAHSTESQHLDELEVISRNIHFWSECGARELSTAYQMLICDVHARCASTRRPLRPENRIIGCDHL